MDPEFKDLLPWQEMSKKIKDLEERVRILEEYNLHLAYPHDNPLRFQEADCYPLYYRKAKEEH